MHVLELTPSDVYVDSSVHRNFISSLLRYLSFGDTIDTVSLTVGLAQPETFN